MLRLLTSLFLGSIATVVSCGSSGVTNPTEAPDSGAGNDAMSFGDGTGADGGGADGPRSCQSDGDCGPGGLCDPGTHTCGCGGINVMAKQVPPNLLFVLDRSCSMQDKVGGKSKWSIAVAALTTLTTTYAGKIRFGLTLFPDKVGTSCTQGAIPIDVAPGNESKIQTLLMSSLSSTDPNFPNGPCVTPIDTAMEQAAADMSLADMTRGDFALLMTDGMQAGCNAGGGDPGTVSAITKMKAAGVDTFVVGFGAAVSVTSLDSFAQAGGEVNMAGPHKFYQADSQPTLDAALALIAASAISCTLQLTQPPPNNDASLIFVYFDHVPPPVTRDTTHTGGWDWDPMKDTVTLYGQACADLKSGKVTDVEVVYGCPNGGVPPPPSK